MTYQHYRPGGFRVLPPIVKNLIIINALVLLGQFAARQVFNFEIADYLAFHYFESEKFNPFQIVTYMFMHGDLWHLIFNMFALWMFGGMLENMWGPKRFIIFYLVTGIGAAVIHSVALFVEISQIKNAVEIYYNEPGLDAFKALIPEQFSGIYNPLWFREFVNIWETNPGSNDMMQRSILSVSELLNTKMNIPTVGASGAVFGILMAFGLLFPNTLIYIYFLFPIKAKWFVIIYGAIELYAGINANPGDNIAHFAHLGGMVFGYLLIKYWNRTNRKTFY